jgi:hypothetical protein
MDDNNNNSIKYKTFVITPEDVEHNLDMFEEPRDMIKYAIEDAIMQQLHLEFENDWPEYIHRLSNVTVTVSIETLPKTCMCRCNNTVVNNIN